MLNKIENYRINGSGLFFFNSNLSDDKKLEILNWHDSLSAMQKEYVSLIRQEAIDESIFFHEGE
jgi:hypothetical protein